MFQRQELTLSLNRVIVIEFPNCDPALSEAAEVDIPFIIDELEHHDPRCTNDSWKWQKIQSIIFYK